MRITFDIVSYFHHATGKRSERERQRDVTSDWFILTDSGVGMRSKVSRMRFAVDDVTDDASDLFTGFAVTVLRCGVNCNTIQ